MYVSIAVMFLCRLGLAYILVWYFDMNVIRTWFAMFIDWFVRAGLYVYRYSVVNGWNIVQFMINFIILFISKRIFCISELILLIFLFYYLF